MSLKFFFSFLIVSRFFFPVGSALAADAIEFIPEGTVRGVRQAHVRFPEPMIPLGDPRGLSSSLEQPFKIQCPVTGTGRWADSKTWVYDFKEDLKSGLQCEFQLKPGIKSLQGTEIKSDRVFSFSTGEMSLSQIFPREGQRIQEDQAFIISLDGIVTDENRKHFMNSIFFQVEGIREEIPAKLIEGSDQKKILESHFGKQFETESPLNQTLVIQSKRPFPPETQVMLHWGDKEQRKFAYKVRPVFSAEVHCERENADSACIPFSSIRVSLSSNVRWQDIKKSRLVSNTVAKLPESRRELEDDPEKMVYDVTFKGPFTPNSTYRVEIPKGLKDGDDRKLSNQSQFPLELKIGELPPLAKFASQFGVIESKPEALLPVTLRNLEPSGIVKAKLLKLSDSPMVDSIAGWLSKVRAQASGEKRGESILGYRGPVAQVLNDATSFILNKSNGSQAFEVVGIPLGGPGFYIVEIESQVLGTHLLAAQHPMYVSTAVLVTDLGVHFKKGRESSLVWVTSLSDGRPVENAQVAVRNCKGEVVSQGKTDSHGIFTLNEISDEKVPHCNSAHSDYSEYNSGLFVTAKKEGDFSFAHTSWANGIEYWRFNVSRNWSHPSKAIGILLDRTLFRAKETVHMKHFLRKQTMAGFGSFSQNELPTSIQIEHQGTGDKYSIPVKWDQSLTSENTWTIPDGAKLGTYEISYLLPKRDIHQNFPESWPAESFRVEEFRVPLVKGVIRPPSGPQVAPSSLQVDVSAEYLSGGGVQSLPIIFRYQWREVLYSSFSRFEGFHFSNGAVKPERDYEKEDPHSKIQRLNQQLDRTGASRLTLTGLEKKDHVTSLLTEMEYRDPNGEVQTSSAVIPIYPAHRLIGTQIKHSGENKDPIRLKIAVVTLKGEPVKGSPVEVSLSENKYYSHRKRLIGGFYAYESRTELKDLGSFCHGKTDEEGILDCEGHSPVTGSINLQAKTKDEEGNESVAHSSAYVYDRHSTWFDQGDDDRIDLIPERKRVEPGEKAVFQVRMPYREATALVTVEREGILDSFVTPISAQKPVIEVPIQKNYSPNVFVSAFVVRGRASEIQPTAMVDLGKPSFKLGLSEIQVGWKDHELKVALSPDKEVYRVREKAKVKIKVTPANGASLSQPTEVLVAAVDEGLLQLSPNETWNLLQKMMGKRGYEVETSTSQLQVVGKRHFGLKAVPHGGGGGTMTRELFETLLFWKARVPVNDAGEAEVEIPLNDSTTAFRVVGVASSGFDLFGTGSASIRSTQDLIILSGLSPVVRQGDSISAEFTVRNPTSKPIEGDTETEMNGSGSIISMHQELESRSIKLGPGESQIIKWNINIPKDVDSIQYKMRFHSSGKILDSIQVNQKVLPSVPVRTYQATLMSLGQKPSSVIEESVQLPQDALPGKGGIQVTLKSSLTSGLSGVKDYMAQYPYGCFEQKASKAIALRDEALWKKLMQDLPSYLDSDGLIKFFPTSLLVGSDILTSYILAISDESGWNIPERLKDQMLHGLERFVNGNVRRQGSLPTADLTIRKITALEAISRTKEIKASDLASIDFDPQFWPTSAIIDAWSLLHRMAKQMVSQAPDQSKESSGQDKKIADLERILKSRLNVQGTQLSFSTESTDEMSWLMVSSEVNMNRYILAQLSFSADHNAETFGKLAQGSLLKQSRGHWKTTTANAWGTLALEKFSKKFETSPVSGQTQVSLDSSKKTVLWSDPKGEVLQFPWPDKQSLLKLSHEGREGLGHPWVMIQTQAAIPLKSSLSSGFQIQKSWKAVEQKEKGKWTQGDVIRVRLDVDSQMDSTWVVVNDPIPAGAMILGSGLGNDSQLVQNTQEPSMLKAWPVFEERSMDSYRSYFEFIPKGKWSVEYSLRLNQAGKMNLPTTRVEAMYSPETFGEIPNSPVEIHHESR